MGKLNLANFIAAMGAEVGREIKFGPNKSSFHMCSGCRGRQKGAYQKGSIYG